MFENMTASDLADRVAELNQELQHLKGIKEKYVADGESTYSKHFRWVNAQTRTKGAEILSINLELRKRNKEWRESRELTFERAFLEQAKKVLNKELFKSISKAAWESTP